MKKSLLYFVLGCMCILTSAQGNAQAIAYVGPRLLITTQTPSPIEGMKNFTWASDPAITGPWGRVIDSIWNHVPLVFASTTETTACTVSLTPGSLTGKWALIWRGDCEFGHKAKKAQDAGAVGVIIINQNPGAGPVNMGAGAEGASVTIPVLMVSNPDGVAIDAVAQTSNQVYVSLTPYGFGNTHDLCIPNELYTLSPGYAIPKDQLDAANGNPKAYKGYLGAWVANTGTSDETNVQLKVNVDWTPTAGSPTLFFADSIAIPGTFAALDSLDLVNKNATAFDLHATTTGTFDFTYSTSCANTDQLPIDNFQKFSMYATAGTFCKSKYNIVAGAPTVTSGLRMNPSAVTALSMTWGPLFYVAHSASAYNIQMALYPVDTAQHDLSFANSLSFFTVLFKWVDANTDGVMQPTEITLVKTGTHEFTTLDSPGHVFVASFRNDVTNAPEAVTLDADAWYWVAPVLSNNDLYLGVDGSSNYYNRIFASDHLATGAWKDFWAPLYEGGVSGTPPQLDNLSDTVSMIPFATDKSLPFKPSDSMSLSLGQNTPSIALNLFPLPDKVTKVANAINNFSVYPNPANAADGVHAKLDFDHTANNVVLNVMSAYGQVIYSVNKSNVKDADILLPTKNLAAGNYYVVIVADGHPSFRAFTVVAK